MYKCMCKHRDISLRHCSNGLGMGEGRGGGRGGGGEGGRGGGGMASPTLKVGGPGQSQTSFKHPSRLLL